jgi:Ni/Fe-hydrogenase subunit HybB-like protein
MAIPAPACYIYIQALSSQKNKEASMRERKKLVFVLLACLLLIAITSQSALAEIKKVKLYVPGCE